MSMGPHDSLFKLVFEQPEHAQGALRAVVPGWVAEALDWSSLARESGSFVDPDLTGRHSDLLFSIGWRDAGSAPLYLLFEHQSTPDPYMAFRLLRYMVRIWERWMAEFPRAERLPVIVPVVLCHGAEAWSAPRTIESLLDVPSTTQAWVPSWPQQFCYVLDDLSEIPDEQLRARSMTALGRLVQACLKHARTRPDLIEILGGWAEVIQEVRAAPHGFDALVQVLRYILKVNKHVQPDTLQAFLYPVVGPDAKDLVMTAGELLIQEGIEKGKREMLLDLLRMRFGAEIDAAIEARVAVASARQIAQWAKRTLSSSSSLAEALAD